MKSKEQKQVDALKRLENTSYKNSKAKRLKTATKEQWQKAKDEGVRHLTQTTANHQGVYRG